jgi:uncharacterized small protein (DUF1192 family)
MKRIQTKKYRYFGISERIHLYQNTIERIKIGTGRYFGISERIHLYQNTIEYIQREYTGISV